MKTTCTICKHKYDNRVIKRHQAKCLRDYPTVASREPLQAAHDFAAAHSHDNGISDHGHDHHAPAEEKKRIVHEMDMTAMEIKRLINDAATALGKRALLIDADILDANLSFFLSLERSFVCTKQ